MNTSPKTVQEREQELQAMLTTAIGRTQLRDLKSRYEMEGGRVHVAGTPVLSYILIHEKEKGLTVD